MKRGELKQIGFCNDEIREIIENIRDNEEDFEVGYYRFINDDVIDEIQQEEMKGDDYLLGCFSAWAIASATSWPVELVEAAQSGEAFEKIGAAMTEEHIANLQAIYRNSDGYGHHFGHYDGEEEEITIAGKTFHVFRVM